MTTRDQVEIIEREVFDGRTQDARRDIGEMYLDGELGSRLLTEAMARDNGEHNT